MTACRGEDPGTDLGNYHYFIWFCVVGCSLSVMGSVPIVFNTLVLIVLGISLFETGYAWLARPHDKY